MDSSTSLFVKLSFNSICYKVFSLQFFTANDVRKLQFLSFSLWKGATALDTLAFHYVTLLYYLLLVIFTVKVMDLCNIRKYCCEYSNCFKMQQKQTVRGSITHGLTAFLLLCYSRFAQVSLMILIPGTLYSKGGAITRQVVFYDGEIDFFSIETHLLYAVPALAVSIVLPLLLMLYPACYNVFSALGIGESKFLGIFCKVISIENLKPILNSFQVASRTDSDSLLNCISFIIYLL